MKPITVATLVVIACLFICGWVGADTGPHEGYNEYFYEEFYSYCVDPKDPQWPPYLEFPPEDWSIHSSNTDTWSAVFDPFACYSDPTHKPPQSNRSEFCTAAVGLESAGTYNEMLITQSMKAKSYCKKFGIGMLVCDGNFHPSEETELNSKCNLQVMIAVKSQNAQEETWTVIPDQSFDFDVYGGYWLLFGARWESSDPFFDNDSEFKLALSYTGENCPGIALDEIIVWCSSGEGTDDDDDESTPSAVKSEDSSDDSCSCGVSSDRISTALAGLMLLVGLVAMKVSARRMKK